MATEKQLIVMGKIFKKSGKTFQVLAKEAGLKYIPVHAVDLTKTEAEQFIRIHGVYLMHSKKDKQ